MEEAALVEGARQGDASAFESLVASHRDLMVRVAYLITGSEAEAEDAAQEALVKAYYALPRFRAGAPLRPWLLRIAANEARNRRKAAVRRWGLSVRAPTPEAGPSPEMAVLEAEDRRAVLEALQELREEDRQVIAHRYLLELNEAETAAALGWPRGTVKSRLSRALTRLRGSVALRAYLAVAALLAILAGVLVASPDLRTAIADRLGIRGVGITHVPELPVGSLPEALEGRGGASPEPFGGRISLEDARRRAEFTLLLAQNPPDRVYFSDGIPGGRVSLLYGDVLLTQFRGDIMGGNVAGKGLAPATRMELVTVNGGPGVWLEGAPHTFFFRDATGNMRPDTIRLAGNVLLWEQNGLAVRLEGVSTKEQALRLANTVR